MHSHLFAFGAVMVFLQQSAVAGDDFFTALTPVAVTSSVQATGLSPATTSVHVDAFKLGGSPLERQQQFDQIMSALVAKPAIRHLKLRVPRSSSFKCKGLERLREFKLLETLDLTDTRGGWADSSLHQHIAAAKSLKHVKLSFM